MMTLFTAQAASRVNPDEVHAGHCHGDALPVGQGFCSPCKCHSSITTHTQREVFLVHLLLLQKLAARNVLVSETEACKVADLDLGSQNDRLQEESNPASALAANFQEGLKDPNRILRWMAPEILLHQHFSTASDVWSYGILMWEMFNPSQLPYPECDDRVCAERIVQGYMMSVPDACPERVAKIMKACWYQNAASRPSFLYISSLLSNMLTEV